MKILVLSRIDDDSLEALHREHASPPQSERAQALCPHWRQTVRSSSFGAASRSPGSFGLRSESALDRPAGSGLDDLDLTDARRRGIGLVKIPGPSAQSVAELTFGLMLDLARKISLADRFVRRAHWPKRELLGQLLYGKTVGIAGAANIGSRVGELAAAWGLRAVGSTV